MQANSEGRTAASIRRIQRELKEISESPSRHWAAGPMNDDLFEWHFTVRGPSGTDFEGGIYTGRIVLPANYPMEPPYIMLLTPNGRWEVGKKICLSNTSYHPELWQPAWGLRTMMEALRSHFPIDDDNAIGALDWPSDLRRKLAKESLEFTCVHRKVKNRELLPELTLEEKKEDAPFPPLSKLLPRDHTPAQNLAPQTPQPPAASQEDGAGMKPQTSPSVEGLRQRRGSPETGGALPSPSTGTPSPSAASTNGISQQPRRRREGTSESRRQRSILVQLAPQSPREAAVMIVDMLLVTLCVSFIFILIGIARNPPHLLMPMSDNTSV